MGKYNNKLLLIGLLLIILMMCNSCINSTENLVDSGIQKFHSTQSDLNLEKINFKGPIVINNIQNFRIDSNYLVLGWYYVHTNDTIWIYTKIDKSFTKKTSVHLSQNFDSIRKIIIAK